MSQLLVDLLAAKKIGEWVDNGYDKLTLFSELLPLLFLSRYALPGSHWQVAE
jgi:hypothetical protein